MIRYMMYESHVSWFDMPMACQIIATNSMDGEELDPFLQSVVHASVIRPWLGLNQKCAIE